jgi:hypothetical protein
LHKFRATAMALHDQRGVKRALDHAITFLEKVQHNAVARGGAGSCRGAPDGRAGSRLDRLMRFLDGFGLVRSKGQRGLHTAMVGVMMTKIFEGESDAEMRTAMEKHKIDSNNQQLMCITPRRFGKTTAVAMFCAALAIAVPGVVISIFSTARRASSLLLQQIKGFLQQIPGASAKIASSNVETIVVRDGMSYSKISSYPGQAKT